MGEQGRQRPTKATRAAGRPGLRAAGDLLRRHEVLLRAAACVGWEWQVETGAVTLEGDAAGRFGWDAASIATIQDFIARIHPEDRALHQASLKQALVKGRGPYASAFRVVRPDDGRVLYVEDRGVVDWERDYATLRVTGYLFEIAPRR